MEKAKEERGPVGGRFMVTQASAGKLGVVGENAN